MVETAGDIIDSKDIILHSPFNIEIHNHTFYYYCEVVILADGTIEYAVPSHQEKLISIYAKKHNLTREQILKQFSNNFSWIQEMMKDTGVISVWYDNVYFVTKLTEEQKESLKALIDNKCISPDLEFIKEW